MGVSSIGNTHKINLPKKGITIGLTLRFMGGKRGTALAREQLDDDYAKATAARLLLTNGAG